METEIPKLLRGMKPGPKSFTRCALSFMRKVSNQTTFPSTVHNTERER